MRPLLAGGDRRSIAQSNRALLLLRRQPDRVDEVASLVEDEDWLVSMRALDLLEKLAHENVEVVVPHKGVFIGKAADSDKWEIRLQVVRALPLFDWTARQRKRVVQILRDNLSHPQTFVRAWALDSLATLADDPRLLADVERSLEDFERSGSKALESRAKRIRASLRSRRSGNHDSSGKDGRREERPAKRP